MANSTEAITQAVESAAETAAAVAENVVAAAEAQVEGAVARAEAAEALNETLTDAAMRGELGNRITELEDEVDTWDARHDELKADLSAMTERCQSLETRLTVQEAELATLKSLPQLLIPAPSPEPGTTSETIITETPSGPVNPNPVPASAADPRAQPIRKRVRIL
jgi:chromosome segregation ATPase